ncbi:MAG: M23 family metallopeptidase [Deltaproteobacteria bacterium]|nr:M23 family metallopeptidase [Deltaproteobacteria bacterium]
MKRSRKVLLTLITVIILAVVGVFAWFFLHVFEGERPEVIVEPLPEFLSKGHRFTLEAEDAKGGLRSLRVSIDQAGREVTVVEKTFPYKGLFNSNGVHRHEVAFEIDPLSLNLAQGRAELKVEVFDHSRRGGGDGNRSLLTHSLTVDTMAPAIRALTRLHYINQGGSCLAVYQTSSDTEKSGVLVGGRLFPGFPSDDKDASGRYTCYFAVPHDMDADPPILLWAEDRAGNQTRTSFYHRIRSKRFRKDRMNITDGFLDRILPYFSFFPFSGRKTPIEKYLAINNELRRQNHQALETLQAESGPKRLWDGPWMRLPNAATMARFADHRVYYYQGEPVDEKDHMGIDLASLANSQVPAANRGRVLLAERLGIYGQAVVLDHGQRLMSLYGHLSSIQVSEGQEVKRGEMLGTTGSTGLAGGDHLHFAVLVNGVPVNPIEWWDPHWIEDNISKKLSILAEP